MIVIRNLRLGRYRYLSGFLLLSLAAVTCAAFTMSGNEGFNAAKRQVLLRKIGHELLLKAGDSTSRVLPVKKIAENEYQISFENEFSFRPASLVSITRDLLAKDPLASDYIVNVLNCSGPDIVYAYTISKCKDNDNVPCIGRLQPKACYTIDIKFKPAAINIPHKKYLLGGLPLLAIIGFIFLRPAKHRKILPESRHSDRVAFGALLFDAKNRKLVVGDTMINLTVTESRLLLILAQSPNEIVERSRLQKEIWEDEGVVVGRSLDMFISKLRKKLECDPNINITVVRGKGYKLEIS